MDNTLGSAHATYSYIKPDTTVFVAEFGAYNKFSDRCSYNGLLKLSDGSDDILLTDSHGDKGLTPSFSLYWQQTKFFSCFEPVCPKQGISSSHRP